MVCLLKNSLFEWTIKLVENSKYTPSNLLNLSIGGLEQRSWTASQMLLSGGENISAMQANTFRASQVCLVKELQLKFSVNITAVSCPVTCLWYTSSMSDKIPIKYF